MSNYSSILEKVKSNLVSCHKDGLYKKLQDFDSSRLNLNFIGKTSIQEKIIQNYVDGSYSVNEYLKYFVGLVFIILLTLIILSVLVPCLMPFVCCTSKCIR